MSSTYQTLQCFLYSRQREGVLFHVSIQVAKVYTELLATILLPHQYHCIAPSTLAGFDGTRFQHFLQMAPNPLNSTNGGGIHLNHSLKGVSSVTFMVCSMEWVQPNSAGSNENTSWYSARSQHAESASSEVQESRPLKSNSSNNLPCLCLTVSLGVWESWDSSAPSTNCSPSGGLGTGDAATATKVFFQRVCKYAVLFFSTTTAFLLPFLNLVYVFCTVRPCSKEPS